MVDCTEFWLIQVKTLREIVSSLKRFNELSIAIPASFVSDVPHLREKTFRIGLVGRAAAIFRVDEVMVFPDQPKMNQKRDMNLVATILSYMETPQYLRKRLFAIEPELLYAGVLPPLRTPHHPTADKMENLTVSEYREGVTVARVREGTLVDIGVEQPFLIEGKKLPLNKRVTVNVARLGKTPLAVVAKREEIQQYWGYKVTVVNEPLGQLTKTRRFDLIIATSRRARPYSTVMDKLRKKWETSRSVLVAFGAPTQGLFEIVAQEKLQLENIADFIVNTIPNQGTETVRTEEALYATLSILDLF